MCICTYELNCFIYGLTNFGANSQSVQIVVQQCNPLTWDIKDPPIITVTSTILR